jgi:hypothetical protein
MSSTKSIIDWSYLTANPNDIPLTTDLPPVPVPNTRIILEKGKYYNIYYKNGDIYLKGAQCTGRYQHVIGINGIGGSKENVYYFKMFQQDVLEEHIFYIYISQHIFEEVKNQE